MKHICKWTAFGICVILALLTAFLVLPELFHIYPVVMRSGSMEPSLPVGSVIYVKKVDNEDLREGMAVTFRLADGETLVTHRIARLESEKHLIYTKGDANEAEDGAATPLFRIVGTPVLCIPFLGYLAGYLSGSAGKAAIVLSVVLVCILSWLEEAMQKQEKENLRLRSGGDQ